MIIEANGIPFNVEIDGKEGAPWIACSHALANNLTLWDDLVAELKGSYSILRYDQRGHGKTKAVPGPYTFPMLIDDAIGIMDGAGVDKAHWIGLSIGGMMGYGLAMQRPERLRSLVACDSRPDAPPDYAAYFQSRIDKAKAYGMPGLVDTTVERWFTPESIAAKLPVIDKVKGMIASTDPVGHEGCCEALKTLSYGPRLNEIRVPTLIIGGAKDKGAPPEALAEAAAKIPGAEHVVVPDAGHISVLENPPAFMGALKAFLAKH